MKILYLYAEVMGYTMATIKSLLEQGAEVHVVYWDKMRLTPYQMPDLKGIKKYPKSKHPLELLKMLAMSVDPDLTVVSGWMDKDYLSVVSLLRKNGKSVVVGFDGQWYGGLKQYLAAFLGTIGYFSRYFSHAWVAGPYQYEYARRLGFKKNNIIFDLYSSDSQLFQDAFNSCYELKKNKYPHRFLFVGRFEDIKGLNTLLDAWENMLDERSDWQLYFIGNGSYKRKLLATSGVVVKDFMQPDELVEEVTEAGCFVLPSLVEPWGVVVHEFAAAGLPLILSDKVGAATTFLIPGTNGYSFNANDAASLAKSMLRIIKSDDDELLQMSRASTYLSNRITSYTSACNLLSLVK